MIFKKAVEPIVMNHDTQAEAIFSKQVENLQATLQLIVNEFNTLEVGTLIPADLMELVNFPDLVYSRYKSLIIDEVYVKEQLKSFYTLNRGFVELSISLPSTSKLIQLIYGLDSIYAENSDLFELLKGTVHLNASLLASINKTKFRMIITDPNRIDLYHLLHKYADVSNELSAAFTALYPNRPALVQIADGSPFEIRAYNLLKADFSTRKVVPRIEDLNLSRID